MNLWALLGILNYTSHSDSKEELILFFYVCPDGAGGMLVIQVAPNSIEPGVPVVEGSGKSAESLTLQVNHFPEKITSSVSFFILIEIHFLGHKLNNFDL